MTWSTDRLRVSLLRMSDAPELFAALDHPEVGAYLGGTDVDSEDRLRESIARLLAGPPPGSPATDWLNFVVRERGGADPVIGRLQATADPRNERSLRIMDRLGFLVQALPASRQPQSYEDGDVVLARGTVALIPSS